MSLFNLAELTGPMFSVGEHVKDVSVEPPCVFQITDIDTEGDVPFYTGYCHEENRYVQAKEFVLNYVDRVMPQHPSIVGSLLRHWSARARSAFRRFANG